MPPSPRPAPAPPKTLAELKAGDEVAIIVGYGGVSFATVDRVTPSGRIVVGPDQYMPSGRLVGSGSSGRRRVAIPTDGLRESEIRSRAGSLVWRVSQKVWSMDLTTLARLISALEEIEAEVKGD